MIIVREYILFPVLLSSDRFVALKDYLKLFYIRLGCATDGAGRFDADAALLRAALYPKELKKVSEVDVKGMLMHLHQVGLVRLYTRSGKGFGEVTLYKQRDSQRKVRYPAPDSGELNFAGSEAGPEYGEARPDDPPIEPLPAPPRPPPSERKNRIEGKGKRISDTPPAQLAQAGVSAGEPLETWLARLRLAWPSLNVDAELQRALTKKAKVGEALERGWFERSWLPGCTETVTRADVFRAEKAKASSAFDEQNDEAPEGWHGPVDETQYGRGGCFEETEWRKLPNHIKEFARKELAKKAQQSTEDAA